MFGIDSIFKVKKKTMIGTQIMTSLTDLHVYTKCYKKYRKEQFLNYILLFRNYFGILEIKEYKINSYYFKNDRHIISLSQGNFITPPLGNKNESFCIRIA